MAWQFVADLADAVAARPWLPVAIGPMRLLLVLIDQTWIGVEDRCTHAGCAFSEDGELAESTIICDCHGSEFDIRTGDVLRGPAERPVRRFPVRVAAERLEVDL